MAGEAVAPQSVAGLRPGAFVRSWKRWLAKARLSCRYFVALRFLILRSLMLNLSLPFFVVVDGTFSLTFHLFMFIFLFFSRSLFRKGCTATTTASLWSTPTAATEPEVILSIATVLQHRLTCRQRRLWPLTTWCSQANQRGQLASTNIIANVIIDTINSRNKVFTWATACVSTSSSIVITNEHCIASRNVAVYFLLLCYPLLRTANTIASIRWKFRLGQQTRPTRSGSGWSASPRWRYGIEANNAEIWLGVGYKSMAQTIPSGKANCLRCIYSPCLLNPFACRSVHRQRGPNEMDEVLQRRGSKKRSS